MSVFFIIERVLFQLLILSDIKNKTAKVESIIISRLASDLQVSEGRITLDLSRRKTPPVFNADPFSFKALLSVIAEGALTKTSLQPMLVK